jgi:NADH-quinone oxidoreductase subunit H
MFLGGYHLPYLYSDGFHFFGHNLEINATLVAIIQLFTFFGKVIFVAWFHLVIRWTLPRFRYDQVINLGWKMLFPAALLNMAITAIVLTFIK